MRPIFPLEEKWIPPKSSWLEKRGRVSSQTNSGRDNTLTCPVFDLRVLLLAGAGVLDGKPARAKSVSMSMLLWHCCSDSGSYRCDYGREHGSGSVPLPHKPQSMTPRGVMILSLLLVHPLSVTQMLVVAAITDTNGTLAFQGTIHTEQVQITSLFVKVLLHIRSADRK